MNKLLLFDPKTRSRILEGVFSKKVVFLLVKNRLEYGIELLHFFKSSKFQKLMWLVGEGCGVVGVVGEVKLHPFNILYVFFRKKTFVDLLLTFEKNIFFEKFVQK